MSVCLEFQSVYLDRQSSRWRTHAQILALVLLGISLSYKVWLKLETVELGYAIAELKEQTLELDYERQELELQYSVITRPDLLQQRAYDQLNLRPPSPEQIVRVVLPPREGA